jgi:hypothetical protein
MENWKNLKYGDHRAFHSLYNEGITQNFDFERRNYDQLKLIELIRYNFLFKSISSFFGFNFRWIEWFSKFALFMHMHM